MPKKLVIIFTILIGFFYLYCAWAAPIFTDDLSSGACKGGLKNMEIKDGKAVLKICNLVTNGSFEASDKGIPGFWIYGGGGGVDTAIAHDGKNSVRLDKPDSLYIRPENFAPVREGVEWYVLSVWVKADFGPNPDGNSVQMRAWGNDTEKKTRTQVVGASIVGTHDWMRIVQPMVPAKDTAFFSSDTALNSMEATGCKMWIDGIQIEEGRRPTAFTEKYYREGLYASPEIALAAGTGKIIWTAESPAGTGVEARWRAANNTGAFEDVKWSEWSAANPLSFTAKGLKLLRFQVRLLSKDRGLKTPALLSVTLP